VYRWLWLSLLLVIFGLLGAFVWLALSLLRDGVPVRLTEPFVLSGPLEVGLPHPVVLSQPLSVEVRELPLVIPTRFSVSVAGPVEAELTLFSCPRCEKGKLLPVRFSLFTGAITWRCSSCGSELGP
jgi:hypothetical protein